jgi:putative salt-induced outer membrane protein
MESVMKTNRLPRKILLTFLLSMLPGLAQAAALPGPVADMIRVAVESGDPSAVNAVVRLAKKSNPQSLAEIDALFTKLKASADYRRRVALRRQRFSQGWKGKGEFGATNSTGNVNSAGVSGALSLVKDGLKWKQSFTASVDYLRHNGVEEKDRYFAGHQVNFKFDDRLYLLGLTSWEGNRAQGFRSRLIASVGAGYSLINAPNMFLSVEASPALRETDYLALGNDNSFAMRVASNYHWSVTPKLTLSADETFFEEGHNQTLTSESALTVKLIDALSARVSYRLQRESKSLPLVVTSSDTTSRVSLVYTF